MERNNFMTAFFSENETIQINFHMGYNKTWLSADQFSTEKGKPANTRV